MKRGRENNKSLQMEANRMKNTRIHELIVKEFLNGNTKIRNLVESAAYEHMKRSGDIEYVLDRVAEMLIEEAIMDCKVHRDYIEDVLDVSTEDINILEFVKENVSPNTDESDIELYSDILDDLTVEVDNNSKLLEEHNRPSLIALVGYACENEIDDILQEWIKYYFNENNTYMANQKENYTYMVKHINIYQNMMERIS